MLRHVRLPEPSSGMKASLNESSKIKTFGEWKSTKGRTIHPTLGEETRYDGQTCTWKRPPLLKLQEASRELENMLGSASAQHPGMEIDGTWEGLQNFIDDAIQTYEKKATINPIRGWLRKSKANLQILSALVPMVPDEKGMSVLKGGLTFVLKSCIHRIETREHILQLFCDIIELLRTTSEQQKYLPDDQILGSLMDDLCFEILDSVRELVQVLLRLDERHRKRVLKLLPQHEAITVAEVDARIANIGKKIANRIQTLESKRNAKVQQTNNATLREAQAIRFTTTDIANEVKDNGHKITTIGDELKEIRSGLNEIQRWQGIYMQAIMQPFVDRPDLVELVQNGVYRMRGETDYAQELGWIAKSAPPERKIESPTISVSLEELAFAMAVNPAAMLRDSQRVMKCSHSIEESDLNKVRWLLSTDQFKCWIAHPFPNVLLVDGYCHEAGIGRTSPLSVFCASLAATMAQIDSTIILYFFCSHHALPEQDPIGGPSGLLRTLLTELITQVVVHTNPSNPYVLSTEQHFMDAVRQYDTVALCALFDRILTNIHPAKKVYCLLDNVSDFQSAIYRRYGWGEQIHYIIQTLRRLADRPRPGPPLKLLLTSANRFLNPKSMMDERTGYVSLRAAKMNGRPARGPAFQQDIKQLLSSPLSPSRSNTKSLNPQSQTNSKNGPTQDHVYIRRPKSAGGERPFGW